MSWVLTWSCILTWLWRAVNHHWTRTGGRAGIDSRRRPLIVSSWKYYSWTSHLLHVGTCHKHHMSVSQSQYSMVHITRTTYKHHISVSQSQYSMVHGTRITYKHHMSVSQSQYSMVHGTRTTYKHHIDQCNSKAVKKYVCFGSYGATKPSQ